jgi:predicted nucleotidyltransferase
MVDRNPNLAILELIAQALGPVCEEVIFVGGCATGLLLTQDRPEAIRITEDVDIVAQALTVRDYHSIEKKVRLRGFTNDMRPNAPICRWVYKQVTLDLMPTVKEILGFANRWYPLAIETAQPVVLPSGLQIRLICAPVFIATKLEAFKDRGTSADGQPDYLGSHDLEDIMTVLDRRPELLAECAAMPLELRQYLSYEFSKMLRDIDFSTTLAGHLPGDAASQARLGKLRETIKAIATLHR